jgi:GT2 family glycosyltransferase
VDRGLKLSIVIPTFNTASMTLGCCRAVLASMPASTEVIVVDDGSSDGTASLMPADVRVVRLETNRGFATAANRGVAEASGDIILLLNTDAVVQAGALQAMLDAFARDAKLGISGAHLLNEDGTPQWSGGPTPTLAWMIAAVSGLGRHAKRFRGGRTSRPPSDWVSGAAMAFRRAVWRDAGPLNERYLFYCQDLELCLRASQAGWDVRVINDARVVHGLGKTIGGQDRETLRRDLLTWGRSHHGRAWWMLARVVLRAFRRT